jgi:hypothetical protein
MKIDEQASVRRRTSTWYHARGLHAATAILLCSSFVAATACSARQPREPAPAPQPRPTAAVEKPPAKPWSRYAEVAAWPPVDTEPFPSQGHGAHRYLIDVRVSPDGVDAYRALLPSTRFPPGTITAAFHKDATTGKPGPIYVMEKREDGWRYAVYGPDGSAVEHGLLELCERCHAESRSDSLFGLPHAK